MPHLFAMLFATLLGLAPAGLQAEQFKQHGPYAIHYNAVNTTFLPPQVAETYGIVRSQNRALLNIAVRKQPATEGAADSAVTAVVKVSAVNLAQQYRDIEMREVRETDAVYYIGVLTAANAETLEFSVEVTPEGVGEAYLFKFTQQFFWD